MFNFFWILFISGVFELLNDLESSSFAGLTMTYDAKDEPWIAWLGCQALDNHPAVNQFLSIKAAQPELGKAFHLLQCLCVCGLPPPPQ